MLQRLENTIAAVVSLLVIVFAFPAGAQEDDGVLTWFTVSPRFWLTGVETIDFDELEKGTFTVPMGGVSITVAPPMLGNLSFAFTAMGGKGTADAVFTGTGTPIKVEGDLTRIDIELLSRYQFEGTPFSIFFGPRFVTFDEKYTGQGEEIISDNQVVVIQFGVGVATDIGDSGRHRVFANAMTGVAFIESDFEESIFGFASSEDTTEPVFDLNTGYQYVYKKYLSMSARYRVFMVFTEDDFGLASTLMAHGPEFGATFSFH